MDTDTLFDAPTPVTGRGETSTGESKVEKVAREREQLEAHLAANELDDVRTRVAYILNQYPTSRNSDVELTIRYWKIFHPEEVGRESITYDALRSVTPMTSISRARATVQNTFRLFVADETIADFRDDRERGVRRKQRAAARTTTPFVYIYADESGKTDKNYIVGSLWVSDVDEQVFKLNNTLNEWRKSIAWTSEIHFKEVTAARRDSYLDFVRQAMSASEYIGFKAVVLAREDVKKRPTDDAIFNLYYRLIVDGVGHEVSSGRMSLPRNVVVHKDEDEGADKLRLLTLRDQLRVECPKQFDNQVQIAAVTSLRSSSNILMQLADVFTGSINRVINRSEGAPRNHKDDLAEEALRLLGLEWRELSGDIKRDFVSVIRL